MSGEQIHYKELEQEALRAVVRKVLLRVEKGGLPGDHHFFIAFDTRADGVNLSKRLKEQYPEEMTIVLQHQFWDFKVHQDFFEVKLSFNQIPERLVIPFASIKVFFDPSVPYGFQFGHIEHPNEDGLPENMPDLLSDTSAQDYGAVTELAPGQKTSKNKAGLKDVSLKADISEDEKEDKTPLPSADILSLDKFRKK